MVLRRRHRYQRSRRQSAPLQRPRPLERCQAPASIPPSTTSSSPSTREAGRTSRPATCTATDQSPTRCRTPTTGSGSSPPSTRTTSGAGLGGDWLGDFQNPAWPSYFGQYAHRFAERYPWVRYYTPVNEIYVTALFSAAFGWWNEQLMSDVAFVNNIKHSVKGSILAMRSILDLR